MDPSAVVSVIVLSGIGVSFLGIAGLSASGYSPFTTATPNDGMETAIFALVGLGLLALAVAIEIEIDSHVVGTGTVLAVACLCVGLGWLVRYRDRRDLLTTPEVDRESARRLGGVSILCGLLVGLLAPMVWLDVSGNLLAVAVLGSSALVVLAIALAYR